MKKRFLCLTICVVLLWAALGTALADLGEVRDALPVHWNGRTVTVKHPGSYRSVIRAGGEQTVLSRELSWDNAASVRYGYIYAPKQGVLNLRMGPRPKASIVVKAKTNRVVLIFDQGEEWTGVLYDGLVGYVMNSTLKVIPEPVQPKALATLSYKGRTRVTTTVYMRMGPGTGYRKVTGLKPGAPVVVFGESGAWSEVEINGWHGYVMTQHLVDVQPVSGDSAVSPASPTDLVPASSGREEIIEEILLDDDE